MKATVQRSDRTSYRHTVDIRGHQLVIDEPSEKGGTDDGPTPQELLAASLAACTAITIEMYAARKGWDIGPIGVSVEYTPSDRGDRGHATRFSLELRLPANCNEEQLMRLEAIATKCPVHRTLLGEVMFDSRVTIVG